MTPGQQGTKQMDIGSSVNAFDNVYADDFNNVADIPFFDSVMVQGREVEVDDLDVIRKIKPIKKNGKVLYNDQGHSYWDDTTLPDWLWNRNRRHPDQIDRDPEGKPWISMKVLSGLALGGINKLIVKYDDHESRIKKLEKELKNLKEAA